ncbi:MAG: DUF1572 family protein [Acidobacteria bacterium]|nr:DUF1572 family protein [Acidobacteriota bacterium]
MERDLLSTLLHVTRTRLVRDYPEQIMTCLDALTDEEIWWRPHEQANAVANLVLHLAGSNRYYLEQVIGGRDVGRDRAAEFAARGGWSKAQVTDAWEQARRAAERVLDTIEPSQLAQTTDRTGKVTTYAQILLHVTHHNAAHMGQIVWITKMLHPGALDEIWTKQSQRTS